MQAIPARTRFICAEPLLEPVQLDLNGISWVIVGGESGAGARPIKEAWVLDLRDQCYQAGVPFFFKQWGGRRKSAAGRELRGRTYDELPERTHGKVREPAAVRAALAEIQAFC